MGNNVTKMGDLMAVNNNNGEVLGKFVYFSLGSVLIEHENLKEICNAVNIEYTPPKKTAHLNAFRSATGDIYDRITDGTDIHKVYCRDNKRKGTVISRELIMEKLGSSTNEYSKLANISFDINAERFWYDNINHNPLVNPYTYCEQAEILFEKYKRCAGRKIIEKLALDTLEEMLAIKISIHGRLYFVPHSHMHEISMFEDFIEALNENNANSGALVVNSMYVMDDEKQRKKMAQEFYQSTQKEIELYQERAQHFIQTNCQSAAVMGRWIMKIDALEDKKKEYETVLSQQLGNLNDEFATLRVFSQELQIRSRKIEQSKAA